MRYNIITLLVFLLSALTAGAQDLSQYRTENEGLDQPVLMTTDPSNPVLYRIQLAADKKWLKADTYKTPGGWGSQSTTVQGLALTTKFAEATDFYFVKASGGVHIYTANGLYVSTQIDDSSYYMSVTTAKGTSDSKDNVWGIDHQAVKGTMGYTIDCNVREEFQGTHYTQHYYWARTYGDFINFTWWLDDAGAFLFYSADPRHADHLVDNGIDGSDAPRGSLRDYVGEITLDGRPLVFDSGSTGYLYSLPLDVRSGGDFSAVCHYTPADASSTLTIDGKPVAPGSSIELSAVSCSRPYTIQVIGPDDKIRMRAKLSFTFLPIVELTVSGANGESYTSGSLRVSYDPAIDEDDDESGNGELLEAAFKYRGATASHYDKKSYAIKLRTKASGDYDRKFFGLRNDNNWILDAASVDPSMMRNRVATDLWNDFSHKPYYKDRVKNERTGTRGRFVEVVLNGSYAGLYCMTEKMDRKQAKAEKQTLAPDGHAVQRGSVYKSTAWKYEVLMGHEPDERAYPRTAPEDYLPYNEEHSETWRGWEIKYPDPEHQIIDWGPLYNCINFTSTQGGTKFDEGFDTYWDMDQVKDYWLFIDLLLATDNHGKNLFLINYDQQADVDAQKMAIGVWDLDGTFGIRWDGRNSVTQASQDYDKFLWAYEHGNHTLFYRLKFSKRYNWKAILAKRYAKLRHTHFDPEALKQRFADYLALFAESGADKREARVWGSIHHPQYPGDHSDIASAVDYAQRWIDERIAFLDSQYAYDPNVDPDTMPDGILDAIDAIDASAPAVAVRPGSGCIELFADAATTVSVYSVSGQLIATRTIPAGYSTIDALTPGFYVVCGQKVAVR